METKTKPLNVLFINIPPVSTDSDSQSDSSASYYVYPPLGIMSIASQLIEKPFVRNVKLLDFGLFEAITAGGVKNTINTEMDKISKDEDYDVICISVMFSMSHDFLKLAAKKAADVFGDSIIVCGGIHATNSAVKIFEDIEEIRYIIRGEGEIALPALLGELSKGIKEPRIPGLITKNTAEIDTIAETPQNINQNFHMYPDLLDMESYTDRASLFSLSTTDINAKGFPVMASRGCPVRCIFCAARTVHGIKPRWRTIDNVREEILWLNKHYGVTRIYLMDDNYVPKSKALELFGMLAELTIASLDIVIQNMSVNHTDFEMIDALAAMGVKYMPLAIESGSLEMQKKLKKNVDLEKAAKLVSYAQSKGLNVRCFYMLGFPGETLSQINQTIDFAEQLGADWSTFSVAVPFPGTEMYDEFAGLGYISDSAENWKASSIRDRVFDTKEFTAEEIKKIAYEANLRVNFVNSPFILKQNYNAGKKIFENFVESLDFHIFAYDCLRRIHFALGNLDKAQEYLKIMKEKYQTISKAADFEQYFHLLDKNVAEYLK